MQPAFSAPEHAAKSLAKPAQKYFTILFYAHVMVCDEQRRPICQVPVPIIYVEEKYNRHLEESTELEFLKSMEARNRGGIGLSYRPARLHRLAEFIPWNQFRGPINI